MRKQFPLYYHLSEADKQDLFKSGDCYFVFDTNALLDIYRLGQETAKKVLAVIRKYKERIVIPEHVACEYHDNMLDIITEIYRKYNVFLSKNSKESILDCVIESTGITNEPSLKRTVIKHLKNAIARMISDIENEEKYILDQFKTWKLQNELSDALGPLVLEGFTLTQKEEIKREGAERYSKKIPPGYMDAKNKDVNIYGDYIIWREILRFAKERQCSVIFIGRDMKDDWLQTLHGMICGPRQELLNEFHSHSPNGKFHIYTLDQFLEFANDDKLLKDSEISEVKELVSLSVVEKSEDLKSTGSETNKKSSFDDDKSSETKREKFVDEIDTTSLLKQE